MRALAPVSRVVLLVTAIFQAVSAIAGGIGLLLPGGIGIPLSVLEGSVFTSFLVPALLLLVVIGGTQAAAAAALLRRRPGALLANAVAGFGMVIWIVVEVAIMRDFVLLHGIYLTSGLAQLALVIALSEPLPTVTAPRDARP